MLRTLVLGGVVKEKKRCKGVMYYHGCFFGHEYFRGIQKKLALSENNTRQNIPKLTTFSMNPTKIRDPKKKVVITPGFVLLDIFEVWCCLYHFINLLG